MYSSRLSLLAASVFSCTLFSSIGLAEPLNESDYYAELPLVFSASRLEQPVNQSPAAVTIIDRDMIEASGALSVADLLRLVPGMMVGHQAGYFPVVSYHGLSSRYSRRMQVLVDGRSVYEPSFGGVKWASLPLSLDDIERIEVVRGPNAAAYGANAFLGVISIITRHAIADERISLKGQRGGQGFSSATLRYGDRLPYETDFRITAEKQLSEGVDNLDDDSDSGSVTLRLDSGITANDVLSFQLGFANVDIEQEGARYVPQRFIDSASDFVQGRWRHKLDAGDEFSLQLFRNTYLEKDYWQGGGILYDRHAHKVREEIEAQHVVSVGQAHRLVWGGGLRREGIIDEPSFNTYDAREIMMRRLFAQSESHLSERLLLNLGLMLEDQDIVGSDVSPHLALNYSLSRLQSLRFSVSRAYRNPVMFEEFADMRFKSAAGATLFQLFDADGNIEPEVIDAYEIGYLLALPAVHGSVDVKLYQDQIDKLVRSYFDSAKGAFNFRNSDSAEVRGLELQLDARLTERTRLFASYAYADIESDNLDGRYSQSVARHKISLLLSYLAHNGWRSGLVYHYVDEMEWLATNDPVAAYDRLDLTFSRRFSISGWSAEWQIGLQNISGRYADFDNAVVFEPRAYLALRLFQ